MFSLYLGKFQGSARCGAVENIKRFCCKFHPFSAVKKFWKSVKIWQSYCL